MLKQEHVDAEEERIRACVAELPDAARVIFYQKLTRELKDPDTYAVLNWCFLIGFHHFYLKQWLRGLLNIAVAIVGISILFTSSWLLGVILLVIIAIFELAGLFRSQIIIQDYNNQLMQALLNENLGLL